MKFLYFIINLFIRYIITHVTWKWIRMLYLIPLSLYSLHRVPMLLWIQLSIHDGSRIKRWLSRVILRGIEKFIILFRRFGIKLPCGVFFHLINIFFILLWWRNLFQELILWRNLFLLNILLEPSHGYCLTHFLLWTFAQSQPLLDVALCWWRWLCHVLAFSEIVQFY